MRWDVRLSIPAATVDADPVAAPATVPAARLFHLRSRDSSGDEVSTRIVVGLQAPRSESLSWELWALDRDDETAALAARNWSLVAIGAGLCGGSVQQTRLGQASEGIACESQFYLRIVNNGLSAARDVVIRATV